LNRFEYRFGSSYSDSRHVDWTAILLSLRLAALTTLILLALGLPLAGWLALSQRRGRWVVDALVALPLVLPPTVLGFYVLVALGPRSPIGRMYESVTGHPIVFSFEGLLVASVLYSLPFAVQPFAAAFAAVDRGLIESAWCLGASRLRTFTTIVVPLARPGIIAGAVLAFAHTVGEFGVVLMVGGNLPGSTRTVSISIYDDVQAFDYARAGRTAALLLAFSFVVLAVTYRLQRRAGRAWPTT
jgi:molybdate transport system permease protein